MQLALAVDGHSMFYVQQKLGWFFDPRRLLELARVLQMSFAERMRKIILPAALPSIFTGLRLAVGAGWLTVVTAEMIAVRSGLGYMILYAQMTFRPDQIVAWLPVMIGRKAPRRTDCNCTAPA